jgi:hypothetical protein
LWVHVVRMLVKIRVVVVIAPSAEARAARAVNPRVRCNVKCVKCNPVPVMCVSRRGPEPPPWISAISRFLDSQCSSLARENTAGTHSALFTNSTFNVWHTTDLSLSNHSRARARAKGLHLVPPGTPSIDGYAPPVAAPMAGRRPEYCPPLCGRRGRRSEAEPSPTAPPSLHHAARPGGGGRAKGRPPRGGSWRRGDALTSTAPSWTSESARRSGRTARAPRRR